MFKLLVIPIVAAILFASFAQGEEIPACSAVGARAGFEQSQVCMTNKTYGQSESHTGFTASLFYSITLSNKVKFWPQVSYANRGGTFYDRVEHPDGSAAEVGELSIRAKYLEFPLLVRFSLFGEAKGSPVLIVGPSFGIILSSEYRQDGSLYSDYLDESDTALIFGGGLNFFVSESKCGAELLYRHPITGIGPEGIKDSIEIRGLSLTFGVSY